MYIKKSERPVLVVLPDRTVLSVADLPDPKTRRWVASRKAVVALAVMHGLLSQREAQDRYRLSDDEINSWMRGVSSPGRNGLKTTRMQDADAPRRLKLTVSGGSQSLLEKTGVKP